MLPEDMEILERGHIHAQISWPADIAVPPCAKRVRSRRSEGANAVVNSGIGAWNSGRIGAVPVIDCAMHYVQLPILIRPRVAIAVRVIAWPGNRLRKSGVLNSGGSEFPAADYQIDQTACARKILLPASHR